MQLSDDDSDADYVAPAVRRPQAPRASVMRPAGAADAAAAADLQAGREEGAAAGGARPAVAQPRVTSLPPPPTGWRFGQGEAKIRLMADGATTADRGLTQVLRERASGQTELEQQEDVFGDGLTFVRNGMLMVGRASIKFWNGQTALTAYLDNLKEYALHSAVALDIEYLSQASPGRPRPNGLGGGKVATFQFSHAQPLNGYFVHFIWLPGYETRNVLPEFIVAAVEEILDGNKIIGHNVAGDITRIKNDLGITPSPDVFDTMKDAGRIFGPRLAWNPRTKWGLAPLSQRMLGRPIAKDLTVSDWESPLESQQIVYGGTDVAVCFLLSELLAFLASFDTCSMSWHATIEGRKQKVQQCAAVGGLVNDGSRSGLLLQRGSARLSKHHGNPDAGVGNLRWMCFPMTQNLMSLSRWDTDDEVAYWFWEDDFGPKDEPNPYVKWIPAHKLFAGLKPEDPVDDLDGEAVESLPFVRGLCVIHGARWMEKNRSLFTAGKRAYSDIIGDADDDDDDGADSDEEEEKKRRKKRRDATKAQRKEQAVVEDKMKSDIHQFKNQPFPTLERDIGKLMILKWKREYNERDVAKAWAAAWMATGTHLCRTSLNPTGGLPNDNNGLESINGVQKRDAEFKRFAVTTFTAQFPEWLSNQSSEDRSMAAAMTYSNVSVDSWNTAFFEEVVQEYYALAENKGFFAVRFSRRNSAGLTVLDIPSRRIIKHLTEELPFGERVKSNDPVALRMALEHVAPCKGGSRCSGCSDSWLAVYHDLWLCDGEIPPGKFDFDLLIDFATAFHTLTPMLDKVKVCALAHRLTASKMILDFTKLYAQGVQPLLDNLVVANLDVAVMKVSGFCTCTCTPFLHTNWCVHICLDAMVKGLIKKLPPCFRSELIQHWRTGRIANASAGGARGYG